MINILKMLENITIILVLYEESDEIIFENLDKIKNFKIIILDNAGNKSLQKKITLKYTIEKYILSTKNIGFSKGYNTAISFCTTEFIFIKNADCFIDQENVLKLFDYLNTDKKCMLVAPTSYDTEGNQNFCSSNLPEHTNKKDSIKVEGNICVESVLGAAMFMRIKDFKEINMFDTNMFNYFSDHDLCRKIIMKKKSIIQLSSSTCIHVHGQSKVKNSLKRIYLREYYFTLDQLHYFFKIKMHNQLFDKLKKKIKKYIFKVILNCFYLNFKKIIRYYSLILAYLEFKKFLKK